MTKKQRRRVWGSVTEMRRGKKYVLRWMQNTPQGRRRKTKTVYGTYREAWRNSTASTSSTPTTRPCPP